MPNTEAERSAPLEIAVGVIVDAQDRVLIARRRSDTPGAGFWEFPGGKQEPGESILACLRRELAEEVGITDVRARPLIRFAHARGPRAVRLHVWHIDDWTGTPGGREGQSVRWAMRREFDRIRWLPATNVILAALRLPRTYLMTPSVSAAGGMNAWRAALDTALGNGVELLRLRAPDLSDSAYERLASRVVPRVRDRGAAVLLDRDPELVEALDADGLHWPAARARRVDTRPVPAGRWFAMSAHDDAELARAERLGADFATLSPVVRTASHPEVAPLGWPAFEARRSDHALPVYALGGLDPSDLPDALAHNAHGIAAIRALWPDAVIAA